MPVVGRNGVINKGCLCGNYLLCWLGSMTEKSQWYEMDEGKKLMRGEHKGKIFHLKTMKAYERNDV